MLAILTLKAFNGAAPNKATSKQMCSQSNHGVGTENQKKPKCQQN